MTSRDFCFWLQGYFEVEEARAGEKQPISSTQAECIRRHLALVFKHEIDPSMGGNDLQKALNKIHHDDPHGPVMRC